MGVRRESVVLSLEDDGFSTKMAKDAAATALLNRQLKDLDGTSIRAGRSTKALGDESGGISQISKQSRRAESDLNKFTGRLSLLATAGATLGPALLPIGVTAVPAMTALAGGLGAAAGAAGVALLAFHGFGDALNALNDYELEPTAAHLQKMHEAMGQLSPAAQQLAQRLHDLSPVIDRLQASAGNGLFPGLNEGLDQILTLAPEVNDLVSRLATEMGRLATDAGASLKNDADWQAFFGFLRTDAAPTLDAFARATGNVIAGLGSLLVAFRPLSRDFTSGLLDMSRGFREWAANLGDSDGFHSFVDYIRENGPEVGAFFEAIAQALIGVTQAAAPWGAAVLPLLTDAAKVFAAIAESPIGPVLYEAAAAMLVFNRAAAVFGPRVTQMSTGVAATRTSLGQLRTDLGTMTTTWATAGTATEREAARMSAAQGRVRATMAQIAPAAKAAAGVGGMLALVDGMSKAGTAAGALETTLGGTLTGFAVGGPWGAAIGTGVGLLLNLAHTNDQAATSAKAFSATLDEQTGALTQNSRAWTLDQIGADNLAALKDAGINIADMTTALVQGGDAWKTFREQMGLAGNDKGALFRNDAEDAAVKVDDLANTIDDGKAAWQLFSEAGGDAATTTTAVGNAAASAAPKVNALSDAIGHLNGWLSKRDALRNYQASLDGFTQSLKDNGNTFDITSEKGRANQAALDGIATSITQVANQIKDPGRRDNFVKGAIADLRSMASKSSPEAAAAIRKVIRELKALKDTPANPKITVNKAEAERAIDAVQAKLQQLQDRTIHITTVANKINAGSAGTQTGNHDHGADGARVPKTGLPYADRHLYLLADGERVTSNRHGQADKADKALTLINEGRLTDRILGLADGGRAGGAGTRGALSIASQYDVDIDKNDGLKRRLRLFGTALDSATKALNNETQARDSLMSTITGKLTGDLFTSGSGGSAFSQANVGGSIGDVNSRLRQQTADANEQTRLENQLKARGMSGPALQALIEQGGLQGLRTFAHATNAQLGQYQSLYGQRTTAVATAASAGAAAVGMTAEVTKLRGDVHVLTSEVKALRAQEKRQHAQAQRSRHAQPAATGKAVSSAAAGASRKRRG